MESFEDQSDTIHSILLSAKNVKKCDEPMEPNEVRIMFYRKDSFKSKYKENSSIPSNKHQVGKMRKIVITGVKSASVSSGLRGILRLDIIPNKSRFNSVEVEESEDGFAFYITPCFKKNECMTALRIDLTTIANKKIEVMFPVWVAGHKHETGASQKEYYKNANECFAFV